MGSTVQAAIMDRFQEITDDEWKQAVLAALSPGGGCWPLAPGPSELVRHAVQLALGPMWRQATVRTRDLLT
ncbi:MAG: hypothetical protein HPY83_19540 [Anaerolineae bacterium]|nr:hypothetical protein [Anaerolineae bacterium]